MGTQVIAADQAALTAATLDGGPTERALVIIAHETALTATVSGARTALGTPIGILDEAALAILRTGRYARRTEEQDERESRRTERH